MPTLPEFLSVSLVALAGAISTAAAPSLTLSPESIPGDSAGTVIHAITGVGAGERVTIERFADFNGNGAIDAGEPSLRTFSVTDGARPIIGGVVNGNVPGDDDAVVNGAIRVDLPFPGVDQILNRQPGKYVIRVTGASGQAARTFEITQPTHGQRFTGFVRNDSNNAPVPFATIVYFIGDGSPLGSVRSDASGAFTLAAPPGGYGFLAFAEGFVTEFDFATLGAGQVVTHDLHVSPASVTISGKVRDRATGEGVPGIFVYAQTDDAVEPQLLAGGLTDGGGNFSFRAISGEWEVRALAEATSQHGYISEEEGAYITLGSTAATVNIDLTKATALIHGRLTGPENAPVPNVTMSASQFVETDLEGFGRSNANGDYFAGVGPGFWTIGTDDAGLLGFREVSEFRNVTATTAMRVDFTLTDSTARLRGRVVDARGNGIGGVFFHGHYEDQGNTSSGMDTLPDGSFDLPVWGGDWYFHLGDDASDRGLIDHKLYLTIVDGEDQTILFIIPDPTGRIRGSVRTTSGAAVPKIGVSGFAEISGVDYETFTMTDDSGSFDLPAINGTWHVSLSCDDLEARDLECASSRSVTINNNDENVFFTVQPPLVTSQIRGRVVNSSGAGMPGIRLGAFPVTGGAFREGVSGVDGAFAIGVFEGDWELIHLGDRPPNLLPPQLHGLRVMGGNLDNVEFKILNVDATVTGSIENTSDQGLSPVSVIGHLFVDNASYLAQSGPSEISGQYSIGLTRGHAWTLVLNCGDLDLLGYPCPAGKGAAPASGSQVVDWVVNRGGEARPPTITNPRLDTVGGVTMFEFRIEGDPAVYDVFGAPAIPASWIGVSTVAIPPGQSSVLVRIEPGANRFFRAQAQN